MTDTEIKKALECCFNIPFADCSYCPLRKYDTCLKKLPKLALDLVNRQQAEIERLQAEVTAKEYEYGDMVEQRNNVESHLETAKAEAIKEFAESLKGTCYTYSDICGYQSTVIDINEIDNLVKEMVGE